MNTGPSLLLLASLTMLGGTPTNGFNFPNLKKVAGSAWDTAAETASSIVGAFTGPMTDNEVPPLLQMFAGGVYHSSSENGIGHRLFLTPYIEKEDVATARKKAEVKLPELASIAKSYAAYITVDKKLNSNLFFWYIPAKKPSESAPLILWLQGGPGGSSMFGLLVEHGPYGVHGAEGNYGVFEREITWAEHYNMLYVDQPAGTGFSFTDNEKGYARNEDDIADTMYEFLKQFFELFPNLKKNDFYITGESYAGKYVPAISYKIHEMNKEHEATKLPLTGLAIGDGLSDPIHQYDYGKLLFQVGLVDENGEKSLSSMSEKSKVYIKDRKWSKAVEMSARMLNTYKEKSGLQFVYNYLLQDKPEPFKYYPQYFNFPSVRKAIHVAAQPYYDTSDKVYYHMMDDVPQSVVSKVQTLLDSDYKVMIYNGQTDVIIPYTGTEQYIRDLKWKGSRSYRAAPRKIWRVKGKVAGYAREVRKFRQVMVRKAGHMLPFDQPEWAFDMITRFIEGKSFGK